LLSAIVSVVYVHFMFTSVLMICNAVLHVFEQFVFYCRAT